MLDDNEFRQLILQKGSELFFKYGFSNTTTQQIAETLGMSKKTIYKYFESKDAILQAIMDKKHQDMAADLQRLVDDPALSFVEKLKGMAHAMALSNQELSPQFIRDLQKIQFESEICQRSHQQFLVYIEKLLEEGVAQGRFRKDTKIPVVLFMAAQMHGAITFETLSQMDMSLIKLIEEIINIMSVGILTDSARAEFFTA